MSLEEVRDWHRYRAEAELFNGFKYERGVHKRIADVIDAHLTSHPEKDEGLTEAYLLGMHNGRKDQSTNPYERAVIEQAMVTECVNIEGRDPTDIIRDIISWHVGMDRGARNIDQPKAATDAQVDVDRALDYMRNFRPLRNALDTFDTCDLHDFEEGLRAAIAHPAPSRAVGAVGDCQIAAWVNAVGAEVESGDAPEHGSGYPGYGASVTFDEAQLKTFVRLVRSAPSNASYKPVFVHERLLVEDESGFWLHHPNGNDYNGPFESRDEAVTAAALARPTADQPVATAGDGVTEEMVERAAKKHMEVRGLGMLAPWGNCTEETRKKYRTAMRRALEAAALASPSAPRVGVPEGWQDIATAPNDGTPHVRGLHVYGPNGKYLYWEEVAGHIDTEDGAFYSEGDVSGWDANDFSHWHPLAAAPEVPK
jgi:hypothetical protein